jgi:trimeric autotransporter adhesin
MTIKPSRLALALASAAMLTVAGCGGGGGDSAPSATNNTPPPIVATTTDVPVTVVDGAIGNATVCLDKNLNGVCDAGEPFGKTDAAGKVTLQVALADAGKFPILAVVGLDAVDADHGQVTTAFTLQAPADKSAVVSPLTTLVQSLVASGATSAQAEAVVKAQTGINVSLFEDFTKSTSADSQAAGTLARTVVLVTQQQSAALAGTLGPNGIGGAVISQADLDKLIQNKLLEILPALVTAIANSNVQGGTTANNPALLALANALVAGPATGLTTTSVATLVAINKQTSSTATAAVETPAAGATLRTLNFTDAANWFSRMFTSTLAQNTPDASGNIKYVDRRNQSTAANVASWNVGGSPNRQSDLHFTGTAWAACALNQENVSSVRDAKGNSTYNYCNNEETGTSNRATFDVSGKTMASVITDVRTAGYSNLSIGDNTPAALTTLLGSTTFPTGSSLHYQSSTPLTEAIGYYPGSSQLVTQYSAAVSAGGTASTQAPGVGCNSSEFKTTNGANSTTLESLISANTGTPCVFGQGSFRYPNNATGSTDPKTTSPDAIDEAWGNSTVGIGTIGTAPVGSGATAPAFYSGNTKLRVAFKGPGTNPLTYYACKERFNTGSTRNCAVIGTGSYTIATSGDARVMTLNNLPSQTLPLTFTRVFIQRGGLVHAGYQNKPSVINTARLNLKATNALFTRLGLPVVDVATPLALTTTSYAGDWEVFDNATPLQSTVLSLKNNGTATCTDADGTQVPAVVSSKACTVAFSSLVNGDFSVTTIGGTGTVTGNANFLTGAISGSYTDNSVTPPVTGTFSGARR